MDTIKVTHKDSFRFNTPDGTRVMTAEDLVTMAVGYPHSGQELTAAAVKLAEITGRILQHLPKDKWLEIVDLYYLERV